MNGFSSLFGLGIRIPTVGSLLTVGCLLGCSPTSDPALNVHPIAIPARDELQQELDEVLEFTYENRHLNLQDHAAWQILHGALAYQRQFQVHKSDSESETVSAVDHILSGGRMKGWDTEVGSLLDEKTGRRGLRVIMDPGTKLGQGHPDQWIAVLSQSDLLPTQTITAHDQQFTMEDCIAQIQWELPRNDSREYSWTLIALTTYLPTDAQWTAMDGETWSIEGLVQAEAERPFGDGACGGSHRLIGMTMALNRHLGTGGKIEGSWKLADERIQQAIKVAQEYQNPDGSFSTNYFARPGRSPDLAQNLGTTGHTLEFLTLAMTEEQLNKPWVKRSVVNLCDLFRKTKDIPLECGALYHATHGLVLYRNRVFGQRTFDKAAE